MSKNKRNNRHTEELLKMGDLDKLVKDSREHHQQVEERQRESTRKVSQIKNAIRFLRRSD